MLIPTNKVRHLFVPAYQTEQLMLWGDGQSRLTLVRVSNFAQMRILWLA